MGCFLQVVLEKKFVKGKSQKILYVFQGAQIVQERCTFILVHVVYVISLILF